MTVISRFAPSPTGDLHIGHLFSAKKARDLAQRHGGTFILRIEDIDISRCDEKFTQHIFDDLQFMGFSWPKPVRIQTQHYSEYERALNKLVAKGVLYRCFKSRKEFEAALSASHEHNAPKPRRISKNEEAELLANGESFSWRFDCQNAYDLLASKDLRFFEESVGEIKVDFFKNGDAIIGRKDIATSYHLCVVYDDGIQNVTDVVRGKDLLESTHIQVILQNLLGFQTPFYHHHPILVDNEGNRLSKRDKSISIRELRHTGMDKADIFWLMAKSKQV